MKRFVDLQDSDVGYRFAWFDTITDKFESHSGEMAWDTFKEFVECYEGEEVGRYRAIYIGGETPRIGPDSTRDPVFRLFESREANMIKTRTWEEINRTLNKPGGVFIGIDPAIEPLLPMWRMGPVHTHMGRAYGKSYFLKKRYEEAKRDALMRHSIDMLRYDYIRWARKFEDQLWREKVLHCWPDEETPLMKFTKELSPIEPMPPMFRYYRSRDPFFGIDSASRRIEMYSTIEWKPIKATPKPKRKKMSKKERISRLENEIFSNAKSIEESLRQIAELTKRVADCEYRTEAYPSKERTAIHVSHLETNYLRLSEKVAVLCEALGYTFEVTTAQPSKLIAVPVDSQDEKNPMKEKPKKE